jgi:hypothetical protein
MDIMDQEKMGPTEFQKELGKLKSGGKMPSLDDVLGAVSETRKAYRPRILKAREQGEDNARND